MAKPAKTAAPAAPALPERLDLVVIGAGPGGYIAAIRAAQLGLTVAVVEQERQLGGTCLRVGCIPSKALLESSEHYEAARKHLAGHGVLVGEVGLDLGAMLARKDRIVRTMATGIEGLFRKHGVHRLWGRGRLDGRDDDGALRVAVALAEGGAQALRARHVVLATGSQVATLPGVALDGDRVGGSTEALAWTEVPARLCVIGAGVIGLELGSVWRRLGSAVTVIEYADQPLPGMDGELRAAAAKLFARQGLTMRFGVAVSAVRRQGEEVVVEAAGEEIGRFDRVLVAVGRRPASADLGLDSVGLAPDARGRVPTDAHRATNAPGVWAIGDLVDGPMLAHKAEEEGVAVAEQIVTGWSHVDLDLIPGVVYTDPEIAAVGQTEEALRAAGRPFRKGSFPFLANGRARGMGATDGFVKVLACAETDRVLGVHMIGPRVGELIAEAAMAMAFAASAEDIARICHAHPTLSEATREAALAVDGRALNV